MLIEARKEDSLIAIYFGPMRSFSEKPFFDEWVKASMMQELQPYYRFFHMDDMDCTSEISAPYPGITLSRYFDDNYY